MSPQNNHLQRPPAAVLYADELAKLKQNDNAPCPPGWQLSLPAARAFILGDSAQNISRKVVISPSAVERMLVTLATGRGLMLVGEPGTAKSLLSELLATAISGDAGLTIQGGASTTEDQIKYGWNYALLINHGPSTEALVPAPLYQGMRDGKIVRFEEITRTPLEVQDCLLGMLSDRVMTVPELTGEASQLYARGSLPTWWTVLPEPSSKITKKIALVCAVTSNSVSPHIKKLTGRLIIKPATACREERGMSEPLIVGIRHHSPACARLVKSLIESQRPRYVLIEGPADFNDRVDELFFSHQLPVAIYSYCQYQDGAAPGRGAWTPFAEFSPEWQALQAARRIQAQTYFIDLPCWAQSEEEDDSPDTQDESQALLLRATRMDNSDTLWDHLFEDESQQTALPSALAHYFAQLRGDFPGDALNRQREAFMARWIAWAVQQNNGDVLVVCGGWHAPALAKMWRECPQDINTPELPSLADAITGCYLTPYSEKRLDVLAGYLSGMPAPVWQNWCWQWGLQQAGEQLLKTVLTRLRQHNLPASTADMAAAHLHAMALAQLRGHTLPLRTDWLDAIAGSLIKEALNAPLPWSYRGVIHPDTDPILLTLIDTLAGDGFGKLAPSTPQPPLPKDVTCELERTAISLPAELTLNRFTPDGLAQSQVLHRLAILEIPRIVRQQGSTLTLAGNGEEHWKLTRPLSQHAALIEAACFGATLQEAARHKLEADMLDAGGIGSITTCLSQAALAGLASFSQQLLEQLTLLIAQENQFAEMGQALEVLYALWRLDEISGMQGAQILQTTLCAAIDRTLWLCESNGRPDEKEFHAHLHSWQALCHILRDLHSGVNLSGVSLSAAVALLERRSQAIHAPALDRGAALGALMRLEHPNASAEAALTMLAQLSPAQSGEALHGLLALARHQLACQPAFIAGFSSHLNQLSDANFINALPDLRAAMAWLPPRERGTLAHQVLEHYQLAQLPVSALQMPLHCPPQAIAHHQQLEQQALASLQHWGVFHV